MAEGSSAGEGDSGESSATAQLEAELDTAPIEIGASYIVDAVETSLTARKPFAGSIVGTWAQGIVTPGTFEWVDRSTGRTYQDGIDEALFLRLYADGSYRTFAIRGSQMRTCTIEGVVTEIGTYVFDASASASTLTMTPISNKTTWTESCPESEKVFEDRYLDARTHHIGASVVKSASDPKRTAPVLRFGEACMAERTIEDCSAPAKSTYLLQRIK